MQSLLPAGLGRATVPPPRWGAAPQSHRCPPFPLQQPVTLTLSAFAGRIVDRLCSLEQAGR